MLGNLEERLPSWQPQPGSGFEVEREHTKEQVGEIVLLILQLQLNLFLYCIDTSIHSFHKQVHAKYQAP